MKVSIVCTKCLCKGNVKEIIPLGYGYLQKPQRLGNRRPSDQQ